MLRIQFDFWSAYGCSLAGSLLALPGRYAALRCGLVRIGLRFSGSLLSRGFVQAYGDLCEFWHATASGVEFVTSGLGVSNGSRISPWRLPTRNGRFLMVFRAVPAATVLYTDCLPT